jgi:hypothetical protein
VARSAQGSKTLFTTALYYCSLRLIFDYCSLLQSTDLWRAVRKVASVIEKEYGAAALNIAMQDGKHAGLLTYAHVC